MAKIKLNSFENSGSIAEVQAIYKSKVKAKDRIKVVDSLTAFKAVSEAFNPDTVEYLEEMVMLLLNRQNKVLGWVKLSQGGTAGTVCDPKVVFAIALQANAHAIILAHNHPSGTLKPSQADIRLTNKIKEAGKMLDLPLLDHLIVSPDGNYYSIADELGT